VTYILPDPDKFSWRLEPKPDITAYELAAILATGCLTAGATEAEVGALGGAARHLARGDNVAASCSRPTCDPVPRPASNRVTEFSSSGWRDYVYSVALD
jgi:hypothetical protein